MTVNNGYLDIKTPITDIEGGSGAIEQDWGVPPLKIGGGGYNI